MKLLNLLWFSCSLYGATQGLEIVVRTPQIEGVGSLLNVITFPVYIQAHHQNITSPLAYTETATAEAKFRIAAMGADVDWRMEFGNALAPVVREWDAPGLPNANAITYLRLDIPELGIHVSEAGGFRIIPPAEVNNYPNHLPASPLTLRLTARVIVNTGPPAGGPGSLHGGLMGMVFIRTTGVNWQTAEAEVPAPGNFQLAAAAGLTGVCGKWFLASAYRRLSGCSSGRAAQVR
jgi:hypothetical protein